MKNITQITVITIPPNQRWGAADDLIGPGQVGLGLPQTDEGVGRDGPGQHEGGCGEGGDVADQASAQEGPMRDRIRQTSRAGTGMPFLF